MKHLALIVGCLLLFAGCAQRMSPQQYQQQLTKADGARSATLVSFGKADTDDVKFFQASAERVERAADDMDDIAPPSDVQAAHDVYVDSLHGLARVMGRFADCARLAQRDPASAADCRRKIEQSALDEVQNDFDEAKAIFLEQGYKLAE